MYDDYDLDYTYTNDHTDLDEYTSDLDEYTSDLDEDYARDSHDYESLAYRHYAWYNLVHIHNETPMIAQKRLVRVTLDIMCYDDLEIETTDWKDLLDLEGDEDVYASIRDLEPWV